MSINVSEVIWTIICFFVLLFVLKKFLFGPLITFMEDRKARVEAGMAEATKAKQEQEEKEAALRDSWKLRSDEAKQLVADGKAADDKASAEVLRQAQAQAAAAEQEARERVQQEGETARNEVNGQMDDLVTALAQQLLQKETK